MPLKMHQKSHESKLKFRLFTALFGVASFTALSYDKANSKQIQSDFKVKFKTFSKQFKGKFKSIFKALSKANSACVFKNFLKKFKLLILFCYNFITQIQFIRGEKC